MCEYVDDTTKEGDNGKENYLYTHLYSLYTIVKNSLNKRTTLLINAMHGLRVHVRRM